MLNVQQIRDLSKQAWRETNILDLQIQQDNI